MFFLFSVGLTSIYFKYSDINIEIIELLKGLKMTTEFNIVDTLAIAFILALVVSIVSNKYNWKLKEWF